MVVNNAKLFTKKSAFESVARSYNGGLKDKKDVNKNTPKEDSARGFWRIDTQRENLCEQLVAVDNDVIKDIWEIDTSAQWQMAQPNSISTRTPQLAMFDYKRKFCICQEGTDSMVQLDTISKDNTHNFTNDI